MLKELIKYELSFKIFNGPECIQEAFVGRFDTFEEAEKALKKDVADYWCMHNKPFKEVKDMVSGWYNKHKDVCYYHPIFEKDYVYIPSEGINKEWEIQKVLSFENDYVSIQKEFTVDD